MCIHIGNKSGEKLYYRELNRIKIITWNLENILSKIVFNSDLAH